MKQLSIFAAALLCMHAASAQERAVVVVNTNLPEAIVYLDAVRMGPAHWRTFVAPAGEHTLKLVAPGEAAWSVAPVTQALTLAPNDTMEVTLAFPLYHHIESMPLGASVFLRANGERRMLGKTPVTYRAAEPMTGDFAVEMFGYRAHSIAPGDAVWNRYRVELQPLRAGSGPDVLPQLAQTHRRRWIDVAAAGLVAAGGILTVTRKFKADRLNDEYQATGDPALRPRIARLDDHAAIALAGMQVGLATIALRFYLNR